MQKKNVPLVKQNVMKLEVFMLGRQIIYQRRKKGWGRGRRERIEREQKRDNRELTQALDIKRPVASLGKGDLLGICPPFYPAIVM